MPVPVPQPWPRVSSDSKVATWASSKSTLCILQKPRSYLKAEEIKYLLKVCSLGKGCELMLWILCCGRRTSLVLTSHTGQLGASYTEATSEEENHGNLKLNQVKNNGHGMPPELCLRWHLRPGCPSPGAVMHRDAPHGPAAADSADSLPPKCSVSSKW